MPLICRINEYTGETLRAIKVDSEYYYQIIRVNNLKTGRCSTVSVPPDLATKLVRKFKTVKSWKKLARLYYEELSLSDMDGNKRSNAVSGFLERLVKDSLFEDEKEFVDRVGFKR